MKKYFNKILNKEYIKFNILSYAILILIVKKLDKEFKIYVNYRIFNVLIILNRNISSLIKETLFKFYMIKIYNKFDIIITFNEIRVKKNYKEEIFFLLNMNFTNISLYYSIFIMRLSYFKYLLIIF